MDIPEINYDSPFAFLEISLFFVYFLKVFDQPNLPNFLREVEQCVESNNLDVTKFSNTSWNSSLPPLSPTTSWSSNMSLKMSPILSPQKKSVSPILNNSSFLNSGCVSPTDRKWSSIIKQKIFELEGPNFCYKPLFSDPPADEVLKESK